MGHPAYLERGTDLRVPDVFLEFVGAEERATRELADRLREHRIVPAATLDETEVDYAALLITGE